MKGYLFKYSWLLGMVVANYFCYNHPLLAEEKPSWIPKISIYNPPPPQKSTSTLFVSVDPQIIQKLTSLLDEQVLGKAKKMEESPSLNTINSFLTPEGFELKTRYESVGIALSEALGWEPIRQVRVISEQNLKQRLTTVARWDHAPKVRSIAIFSLSSLRDPVDLIYFKEALWSHNIGIRYSTLEALVNWGYPEAIPLLQQSYKKDDSPLIRIIAATALARMKDPQALGYLRNYLNDSDWLIRALAAKALGEMGDYSDYDLLLNRLSLESTNDWIISEICIGALRLFPQKYWRDLKERERKEKELKEGAQSKKVVEKKQNILFELEPLVVTAPRLKIPKGVLVDPRINFQLMKQLREKEDFQIHQDLSTESSAYRDMDELLTPSGIRLKTRYTNLGYLLTEGLAGTSDFQIQEELARLAREGKKTDVRSYALIALAYNRDRSQLGLFQNALQKENEYERFPAMEALQIWGYPDAVSMLLTSSKLDRSAVLRLYAAQAAWRKGQTLGKDLILRSLNDEDWVIRAMAMRYLGELGDADDYNRLLGYLGSEQKPIVQAEMLSALLRLFAKKNGDE